MFNGMIPYGKQNITQHDIDAVVEALTSNWLTQGPHVSQFERAVANKLSAKQPLYGVTANSATSCLHLACLALGLDQDKHLWTSPNTFVASANCGRYCGANVDFVDINPRSFNLCPEKLAQKLSIAKENNTLPHIVVAVHFAGQSCEMEAIYALSKEFGFKVIEDASHAIGGRYQGQYIGNGRYSDVTIFSFHPVKILTTAEGGIALTQHSEIAQRMENLRSHGITRGITRAIDTSIDARIDNPQGAWYYEQESLGFNYRMSDLQAALGISQLSRLDEFVRRRKYLANRYTQKLASLPLATPIIEPSCDSAWHLYVIQLAFPDCRRRVFDALRASNIGVHVHYIPVHTHPYYRDLGFKWGDFPLAENYYHAALTLPLFFDMTCQQQDTVITALADILTECALDIRITTQ